MIDIGPAFSYNDASTKRKKPAIRSPCSVSTGGRGAVHCRKPSDPARPALQASPKAYSGKENPQCRVTTLFARWKPVYDPATNTWKNTTAVFMCPQCMTYYEVPDWDPNA